MTILRAGLRPRHPSDWGRTTPRTSHKCVPSPLPRGRNVRFGAPPPRSPRSNDTTWETGGRRYPGRATDQAEEETELSRHEEGPRRHDAALAHARLRVVSRPWQIPHPDRRPNRGRRCSAAPCGGRRDPPLLAPRDAGRHLSTCHTPQRTRLLRIVKPPGTASRGSRRTETIAARLRAWAPVSATGCPTPRSARAVRPAPDRPKRSPRVVPHPHL